MPLKALERELALLTPCQKKQLLTSKSCNVTKFVLF